ncbi:hypothetical protein FJT64_027593 [Amphibalanus amphitrite]|uniref:Uncharacterized protein n=1 Tax=Amphibalanus amphitrite TaxID=1232801 RepID=A0A6A4W7W8_AMPAM|nr:hypothetical protein FJT64_027593 [Amphibalanus amphitrite]
MALPDLVRALKESLKDPEVISIFQEQVVLPIVSRELASLREAAYERDIAINELEQYSRKNNVVISGLHEHQNESPAGMVVELGRILDVDIRPGDIDAAHRFGRPNNGKPRPIVVRFVTHTKRDQFYRERKNLRDTAPPNDSMLTRRMLKDVFVADNLTRYNSAVMFAARELKREGRIGSCWTDSGKMKVKTGGRDSPTKIVRSAADLRRLVGDHAALDAADGILRPQQAAGPSGLGRPHGRGPGSARAPALEPGRERAAAEAGPAGADPGASTERDISDTDGETSPDRGRDDVTEDRSGGSRRSTRKPPARRPAPDAAAAAAATPVGGSGGPPRSKGGRPVEGSGSGRGRERGGRGGRKN